MVPSPMSRCGAIDDAVLLRPIFSVDFTEQHLSVLATGQDYDGIATSALARVDPVVERPDHSLMGSLGCQSTAPTEPLCPPSL